MTWVPVPGSSRRSGSAIAICLAGALLAACEAPPVQPPSSPAPKPIRSYVVLLPDDDGGAGKVTFESQGGKVSLDQAHSAVAIDGTLVRFEVNQDRLAQDAGAALQARPRAPRSFQLYFDAGETRINKASEALLPQIVEEVKGRAAPDISVIGHTDTVGNSGLNEKLSLQRAQEVAQQLRALAPRTVHVDITSHGERNLLVPTPDNTDEPRNRRVEITVR